MWTKPCYSILIVVDPSKASRRMHEGSINAIDHLFLFFFAHLFVCVFIRLSCLIDRMCFFVMATVRGDADARRARGGSWQAVGGAWRPGGGKGDVLATIG